MQSVETIYRELLASFADRAGFTPETGCDLAVRLWAAAAELQEKREIAVTVKVLSPTTETVNVGVAVAPKEGADREAVLESARQAISDFFSGRLLGRAVLLAELGDLIVTEMVEA